MEEEEMEEMEDGVEGRESSLRNTLADWMTEMDLCVAVAGEPGMAKSCFVDTLLEATYDHGRNDDEDVEVHVVGSGESTEEENVEGEEGGDVVIDDFEVRCGCYVVKEVNE